MSKIQLPSRRKAEQQQPNPMGPPQPDYSDAGIVTLARQLVEIHAKPRTRDAKLAEFLAPLPENVQRKVFMCAGRIQSGLTPKVAKDENRTEWKFER